MRRTTATGTEPSIHKPIALIIVPIESPYASSPRTPFASFPCDQGVHRTAMIHEAAADTASTFRANLRVRMCLMSGSKSTEASGNTGFVRFDSADGNALMSWSLRREGVFMAVVKARTRNLESSNATCRGRYLRAGHASHP